MKKIKSISPISLKRKIGQLFIVATPLINEEKKLFETIKEYINLGVGGFMIGVGGKCNFVQTDGVTDIKKLKKFVLKLKELDPTLFLAIDGEGGEIFNLFEKAARLKCAREYGLEFEKTGSVKRFEKDIDDYVSIMKECGINMNFAPVLGTAQKGYKGYLSEYGRSYSDTDETVKILSGIAVKTMQQNKIIAVGKHFPGYGSIDENPHQFLKSRKIRENYNMITSPFACAIQEHFIQGIMKGHVLSRIDGKIPATLSSETEKYLRKKLKFNGLSIIDEIFMRALSKYYIDKGADDDGVKRIVQAAKCNDILLMSYPKQALDGKVKIGASRHDHFPRLHNAVYLAALKGDIPENKINDAYQKIIRHKRMLGLR